MTRTAWLAARAYWWAVHAKGTKERVLRRLQPSRMHFVDYTWPLVPAICPCDVHFCDYLEARQIRGKAIFHFGTGRHHLVGLRNRDHALGNQVFAVTASPGEHRQYVKHVIRDPGLAAHYRVLFADIYSLHAACLPVFDVVTLFHLCEFAAPGQPGRHLDDLGVLRLLLSKVPPHGRLVFYARSLGRRETARLVETVVAEGWLAFEEEFASLLIYRAVWPPPSGG